MITATVNAGLSLGHANVGYMFGGASDVDMNADAMVTLMTTSINAFFHQIALAPAYCLVVAHQTLMCQLNGVLAIFDPVGVTIRLQSAELTGASDVIAGQCLSVGDQTAVSDPALNLRSVAQTLGGMAENAMNAQFIRSVEPLYHMTDGTLAYLIGVMQSIGTLVKSQNLAKCNPPNFVLDELVQCACDDTALTIRAPAEPSFDLWCTGTLSMVDGNGAAFVVYNPYTLARLHELNAGMQAYVTCRSSTGGHSCAPPRDRAFTTQGVTALNVLVKCRENFVRQRWDPAAHILFNRSLHSLVKYSSAAMKIPADPYGTGACLQAAFQSGTDNEACLDEYLLQTPLDWDEYWAYDVKDAARGVQYTDACVTFSGPAAKGVQAFVDCDDGGLDGACMLNGHCWSAASNNDHPVCHQHTVHYNQARRTQLVAALHEDARQAVSAAYLAAMAAWNGTNQPVKADFFSVEGDLIHQTMDCIFMGPYARVDYWATPVCQAGEECLSGPFWSRDLGNGTSRRVDPDTCESQPTLPYTCGSPARQSLMRYLVNDLVSQSQDGQGSAIQQAVLAHIGEIWAAWSDKAAYRCVCPDGSAADACCTLDNVLPPGLNADTFEIRDEHVLQGLGADFQTIWDLSGQSASAWTMHMHDIAPQELAAYNWSGSPRARREALLDMVTPSYTHGAEEAASAMPDNQHSLWDACHGALKHVFFTMPVEADAGLRFGAQQANGTIEADALSFDKLPYDGDPAMLEQYIRALSREAFLHSPMYRHYYPAHAPSDSQMCDRPPRNASSGGSMGYDTYAQAGQTMVNRVTMPHVPAHAAGDFSVGGRHCLCGWDALGQHMCHPQDQATREAVCELVPCDPLGAFNRSREPELLAGFSAAWDCPEAELSAHWGLMDPDAAEAWLTGATTLTASTRDLLEHGRAGARIGSLGKLAEQATASINPAARDVPLEFGRLGACGYGLSDRVDLADRLVAQLFPMAQGVEESAVAAYCTRYVLESARLAALELVAPESLQHVEQREQVALWRTRCGSQLRLLGMCVNLGLFRPLARLPGSPKFHVKHCRHFAQFDSHPRYRLAYSTPECLVNIDGLFYDPCRCVDCRGGVTVSLDLQAMRANPACKIRFDPRYTRTYTRLLEITDHVVDSRPVPLGIGSNLGVVPVHKLEGGWRGLLVFLPVPLLDSLSEFAHFARLEPDAKPAG